MTTVAYRAGILAADSQMTMDGSFFEGHATKIMSYKGLLVAGCGRYAKVRAFTDWIRRGMDTDETPSMQSSDDTVSTGIIILPDEQVISLDGDGLINFRLADGVYALGSGTHLAWGAMLAGATAEEAVKLASKVDINTGGNIISLHR